MPTPATTPQRQNYTIVDTAGTAEVSTASGAQTAGYFGWEPTGTVLPTDSVTPCPQFVRA